MEGHRQRRDDPGRRGDRQLKHGALDHALTDGGLRVASSQDPRDGPVRDLVFPRREVGLGETFPGALDDRRV